MNKFKILLVLSLFITSYAGAQKTNQASDYTYTIKGELVNIKNGVKITLSYMGVRDTTSIQNGKFAFNGSISDPVKARLYYISDEMVEMSGMKGYKMHAADLYLSAGTTTVKGNTLLDAGIKGNQVQDEYNLYLQSIKPPKQDSLNADEQQKIKGGISQTNKQINAKTVGFISDHPDSYVSLSFLSNLGLREEMGPATVIRLLNSMSSKIKAMDEWKKLSTRIEGEKGTSVGSQYTDFTKKDINGKDFTLSSIRGKYVLLDFWGSWCGPCRRSHPHLKEVYEKYKSKGLEIIGIAEEKNKNLDECETAWKKAVKEDGLPWIQVINNYDKEKDDLVVKYGIQAFPTKILLDKNGKIVFRVVGGNPEKFDEELQKLIGV